MHLFKTLTQSVRIVENMKRSKRDLKARQVSMIAIGGTIGTGLFVSTGSLLSTTGQLWH